MFNNKKTVAGLLNKSKGIVSQFDKMVQSLVDINVSLRQKRNELDKERKGIETDIEIASHEIEKNETRVQNIKKLIGK